MKKWIRTHDLTACSQQAKDESVTDVSIDFEEVGMLGPMSLPITMNIEGDTLYVSVFHGDSLLVQGRKRGIPGIYAKLFSIKGK